MANPNRAVAAWRNQRWLKQAEQVFNERTLADITADQWRADNPNARVTVRPFKIGPKGSPMYHYAVRMYEVA